MKNQELLKIYSAYLPYKTKIYDSISCKLKVMNTGQGSSTHWVGIKTILNYQSSGSDLYKLVLRPLSDLTKEIEHNGEKFVPMDKIKKYHIDFFTDTDFENYILDRYKKEGFWCSVVFLPSGLVDLLLKWHFDTHGLLDQNRAINLNKL